MSDSDKKTVTMADEPDVEVGEGETKAATALEEAGVNFREAGKSKALHLLANRPLDFDPNSPEAKRVLRKIDMRIMPMVLGVYLLQLMDKNSLSFAAIMGIKTDAHLNSSQYSWLGSLVYFGYLGGEIPATILMQRFPLAKYLGIMSMIWGIIVAMHAVCTNFGGLATVRLLLGMVEVCTTPSVIYITSSWYTRSEQVTRVAIWYTTSGWASVFGGFFAWAIYQANSFRWQGLFVLYGSLTFVVGLLIYFFLAASPTDAKWLTDEEKAIALERIRENKTGSEVWAFNSSQLKETLRDIRFYLIILLMISTGLPNGGLTAFGPTIIDSFGYDVNQTTLLSMAPGAAAAVVLLGCVGIIMMFTISAEHNAARYGGYILTLQFPNCVLSIVAFMTAGVGGTTKKFLFSAAYQLGYAVGNIVGPQTFRAQDAPNYYPAKYTMLAFLILTSILIATFGLIHWSWNRKRDRQDELDAQNGIVHVHLENEEFTDQTDFHLRSFRYPL
ncbi:hypothetical protein UA08_09276 [Talaromyces atroroseus]|uniref:Major facilitator superfamily (MFS) profile domain-containing protein n=1 Tax=Talaromyces atroroseus TaxID=1441469 RepID=A0A1Q5Q6I1_TALAT|nr:hypothetical protein UA08_09276 [Talaromyces atroroseus]OKL55455.1 hypothetical protein UA08_09276 [Talaromyces atroroseus]